MSDQVTPIGTRAVFIPAPDGLETAVRNLGPGTVYYGNTDRVSASSNDGSIAVGSSAAAGGRWFISASSSLLVVVTETVDEATVDAHGLVAGASGTDDTAALNRLLARGGYVRFRGGESYIISDPLVVPSNTTLDATGATITLVSESRCNLVQNAAVAAVRRVLDAAITSSDATLTSATGAFTSADVGKAVTVQGAGASGVPLTTTISSVTNSTTVELATTAGTTVTGQYAAIGPRDSNIKIIGGTWDRQDNTDGTNQWNAHSLRFRHVDGLTVRDTKHLSTAGKYEINPGDCTDVHIENIRFPDCYSDGVHFSGPIARAVVRGLYGDLLGDDILSFTARDSTAAITDCAGDITDVDVSGVFLAAVDPAQFASALKLVAGKTTGASANYTIARLTARNLTAPCETAAVAYIGDTSGGNLTDIVLDGVRSLGGSTNDFDTVYFGGAVPDKITLRRVMAHANDRGPVLISANVTAGGRIVVEDGELGSGGSTGNGFVTVNGAVAQLVVTRCVHKGASGGSIVLFTNGLTPKPSVPLVQISDCHLEVATGGSGASLVRSQDSGTTLGTVEISNCICANSNYALFFVNSTVTVLARNVRSQGASLSSWGRIDAAGVVTLYGEGLSGTLDGVNITAGGSLRCKSLGIPLDVGTTGVAETLGDMAYNTNAARACGVGPVVSDGTTWKHLHTDATF